MEHQKILNLLNEANGSKFVTRKSNIIYDRLNLNYDVRNEIVYNTALKSNLCDYNKVYVLVRSNITVAAAPATQVSFKNCVPFTKCITEIDGATIDDAKDLDLVMPMYNLIEYSSNYSETTGSLRFYSKDEITDFNNNIKNADYSKSFNYKVKLLENTVAQPAPNNANGIL